MDVGIVRNKEMDMEDPEPRPVEQVAQLLGLETPRQMWLTFLFIFSFSALSGFSDISSFVAFGSFSAGMTSNIIYFGLVLLPVNAGSGGACLCEKLRKTWHSPWYIIIRSQILK